MAETLSQVILDPNSKDPNKKKRINFLSRIFGIFSEEIVRIWLNNSECKYKDYGCRPTIVDGKDVTNKATLDFAFIDRNRKKGRIYIVEQKNFYGWKDGKITKITNTDSFEKQFKSWSVGKSKKTPAWDLFINYNNKPCQVKVNGKRVNIDGNILIWASYDEKGKNLLKKKYNISEIISLDDIVTDLIKWKDQEYLDFVHQRKKWTLELFNNLSRG